MQYQAAELEKAPNRPFEAENRSAMSQRGPLVLFRTCPTCRACRERRAGRACGERRCAGSSGRPGLRGAAGWPGLRGAAGVRGAAGDRACGTCRACWAHRARRACGERRVCRERRAGWACGERRAGRARQAFAALENDGPALFRARCPNWCRAVAGSFYTVRSAYRNGTRRPRSSGAMRTWQPTLPPEK